MKRLVARAAPHISRSGWALVDLLASPALSFMVTPFLLRHLGAENFGLWAFAFAVAGFGSLVSVGVGVAATKYVAEAFARNRPGDAVKVSRAALTVTLLGILVLLAIMAVVSPLLSRTVFERMGAPAVVQRMLLLGVVLLAAQELDAVYSGVLRGIQRFDVSARVELVARPLWALAVVLTAMETADPAGPLMVTLAVSAGKVVFKAHVASRLLSGPCGWPSADRADLKRMLAFGKWLWLQGVGGMLFSVADRLLIGSLFGPADLARYSVCIQLAQLVHSTQAAALQTLVPWVSSRNVADGGLSRTLAYRVAFGGGAACLVLPILLAVFTPHILSAWMGAPFAAANATLCIILIVAYGLLSANIPVHYLVVGLGKVMPLAVINLLSGVLSVTSSLMLAGFGLNAFVLGKLLFAPLTFVNFLILQRHLQR
jgi:O-antigen/teichoic acid export membrane protein